MPYSPPPFTHYLSLFVLLFGHVIPPITFAQSRSDTSTVDEDIEAILEYASEDDRSTHEHIIQELRYLADHPLNVNTTSVRELLRLPALTPLLARRIVQFREVYGEFASVDELRAVEGFSRRLLAAVRPYLVTASTVLPSSDETSSSHSPAPAMHGRIIQQIGRQLELGRGYHRTATSGPVYEGSPYHLITRSWFQYGESVEANLTLEKDPAEPFGWHPSANIYGFDFWSAHLALRSTDRPLKLFLVGDYVPVFGRGLVFAHGSGFGGISSRPVRSAVTYSTGLKPYRSTAENRFFRGAAATLSIHRRLQVTAFASRRTLDASLRAAPTNDTPVVTRRVPDGFHRTPTERTRKDVLGEVIAGGAVEWSRSSSRFGITGYHASFTYPFFPGPHSYQQYNMRGRTARMISLYGEYLLGSSHWFGETARAPGGAVGSTGGVDVELLDGFEAVVLVRHFPKAFTSLYARGRPQNETGVYTALRLRRLDSWDISAAFDQYWHPWIRYNITRPTTGYTGLVSVIYRPRPRVAADLRLRSRTTERRVTYEDRSGVLQGVGAALRQTLRLQVMYQLNKNWRLRTRVTLSRAHTGDSPIYTGSLLYQELRWSPTASLQFDSRITLFSTEDYAARLYAYENDLLYSFSVPMLNGRGQRFYLLSRWMLRRGIVLQCKYSVSRFLDRTVIGSGWDEISGHRLREVKMQLRVKW